jgi:hypothetical protein
MKSKAQWVLIFILIVLVSWVYLNQPEPPPPETITVTKTDTLTQYIESDPIIIKEESVVRDTVIIYKDKEVATEVAQIDTTFDSGAQLAVSYYLTPHLFELEYIPAPVQVKEITTTKTITEYIDTHKKWDRAKYGFWSGIATTAIVVFLVK